MKFTVRHRAALLRFGKCLGFAGAVLGTTKLTLEYCSIHVYGEGKWQHFTGAASGLSPEIEARLTQLQDHSTNLLDLAEENLLGVRYMQINKGTTRLAVLAIKSRTLPADAFGTIAALIGVQVQRE